ncbi:class D sortase [Cytobacillus sp. Hz8]|uniref:class D sortase n=1 Tax=Cytobacillus sp. Hz8 TaxID=3347168 RepID=UPI0035DC26D5
MLKQYLNKFGPYLIIGIGLVLFSINSMAYIQSYLAIEKKTPILHHKSNWNLHLDNLQKLKHTISKWHKKGEKIGELAIPKLKETYPILEGTSSDILKKAVGHYTRSALPGESNNSVLSAHRDTFFRGLEKLKKEDVILVNSNGGTFRYKIKKIRIVDAQDQTVITPKPKAILTLTTCYPFYFIGNAPKRYIVVAELISFQ